MENPADRPTAQPVHLQNVSKRFGKVQALRATTLSIGAGQLVSLLGPSGCGKTTTLRLIAGFESPDTGDITIGGESVLHLPPDRRGLGMVFQNYSLFPHLDVAQNIAFGLRMAGVPKAQQEERVKHMLALIQLDHFGSRRISQLSGGQQQRVALARALATNPSVLLLDEPLGALDKNLREGMQDELIALQEQFGITSVLVTHDQDEALTMSDCVVVMNQGRILQAAAPRELYDQPKNRFVAEFLGTANILQARRIRHDETTVIVGLCAHDNHEFAEVSLQRPTWELPSTASCEVAIRPEKIMMIQAGHPHHHAASQDSDCLVWSGQVVSHRFRGAQHTYQVAFDGLGVVFFVTQQAGAHGVYAVGTQVDCYLHSRDFVLLEPEAAQPSGTNGGQR